MTTEQVSEAMRAASARLDAAGVCTPAHDAAVLLAHALGVDVAEVHRLRALGRTVPPGSAERFEQLVAARAERVPLQHLTGRAGFRTLELAVGPGVFVPRPETELLVDLALDVARSARSVAGADPVVVDLCTGSGAIALAIKTELPAAQVYAVELSELAHGWAAANQERLGLDVDLRLGDALDSFTDLVGVVDVVTSNPPYIPSGMVPVDPEVRDHDPEIALYGGSADGLAMPLAVAARAAELLRPGGVLVMEHADVQGESLARALRESGPWADVTGFRDLADRPRAVRAVRADT